jgi:hypothetical protein
VNLAKARCGVSLVSLPSKSKMPFATKAYHCKVLVERGRMSARQGQNEFSLQLYRVYRGYNPHNLLDTVRSVPGAMQSPRNPYKLFVSRIRSPITRRNYEKWLERFFEFIKLEGLEQQPGLTFLLLISCCTSRRV